MRSLHYFKLIVDIITEFSFIIFILHCNFNKMIKYLFIIYIYSVISPMALRFLLLFKLYAL